MSDLPGMPGPRLRQLERMGLATVEDLLFHFPRRHEDRRAFAPFPREESDTPISVCGIVARAAAKRIGGWKKMFEVVLREPGNGALAGTLTCRWFNLHYLDKIFAVGQRVIVFGKPKTRKGAVLMDHPDFEILEEGGGPAVDVDRIVPIYPSTEGLTQRQVRHLVFDVLAALPDAALQGRVPETLDPTPFHRAVRDIHFPPSYAALEAARRHLVADEFFAMQLFLAARRAETVSRRGASHCGPGDLPARFLASLPFVLTGAQRRAIEEIRRDLASPKPMNRLLHGDVGSGKTYVALAAMLHAVEAGFQAALMAPTQILAEQHYLSFRRLLEPLGVAVRLRTGARDEDAGPLPLFAAPSGGEIIVGTHALLFEDSLFSRLGLVVVDEQHKFGVLQRAKLIRQGDAPDVLVMTATPIPRTYTMTIYGDLDVSTLDELPAGRAPILTRLRDSSRLPDITQFIRDQIAEGRQAYVVYPLIEESEKVAAKAAALEFEAWRKRLAPAPCGLLHGRTAPEEKDATMAAFRSGELRVLVCTSVIEVGIDVPNATIVLIENAERFGLAQLHQLRGRVGRGIHKSYCILLSDATSPEAIEKLRTLERTNDGFQIAEADLRLRGPGDILGTAQSGLPPLRLGDPLADAGLMLAARQAAAAIFESDPLLERPEHARYKCVIEEGRKLMLAQVS